MTTVAEVVLWGRRIGAVSLLDGERTASFQYTPEFARSGIEVSPLAMPLSDRVYAFEALPRAAFHGLPGLVADSLPDRFGHALINAWLARQGRTADSFDAVERLCYTGSRGMGALEYVPALGPDAAPSAPLQVAALVELASRVLRARDEMRGALTDDDEAGATLADILRVGTSAGGARAKAVIAYHPGTGEVRSGQVDCGAGWEHWILKFDGVDANRDRELADPLGYGAIEYAYHRMAVAAGIEMMPCRLFEEGGRRHFMTRRFDRTAAGGKRHMQSLAALGHFDFNAAGVVGYEQVFDVMRRLDLPTTAVEQQFRRMVFNVVARNQDDHVKNIAFLMDRGGRWSLSPAFDVTYAHNPDGAWTSRHQMTIEGKRDGFTRADFRACARIARLRRGRADAILDDVAAVVGRWLDFADGAGVEPERAEAMRGQLRLTFARE